MPYLRKTATYMVESASGETLIVDEFEPVEPSTSAVPAAMADKRMILRNGEPVVLLTNGTLCRVQTGERLTILAKD